MVSLTTETQRHREVRTTEAAARPHDYKDRKDVEVFGREVQPGQLIHADKHGFLAIPPEDEPDLLAAALFMDTNECRTVIAAARGAGGLSPDELLGRLNDAGQAFTQAARERFKRSGEW